MDYPAFRVTEWLSKEEHCDTWYDYLNQCGHSCAIVKGQDCHTSVRGFSVWRIGREAMSKDGYIYRRRHPDRIIGEIIKECRLFGEYIRGWNNED